VKLAVMKSLGVGVAAERESTSRIFNVRKRNTAYCSMPDNRAEEQ
jgi:hypothetical protein